VFKLRRLVAARGLSVAEVARGARIMRTRYEAIAYGVDEPTFAEALRIARFFRVPAASLGAEARE
jgi:transcriptional regulator with XRE-family HTH domain